MVFDDPRGSWERPADIRAEDNFYPRQRKMTEDLTPTEKNALKWVQFDEKMAILHSEWLNSDMPASAAWDQARYQWRLFGGGQ